MNLQENIKEGVRSIKSNLLRTVLTALIVALGIMCLVGMLTCIDGIQSSVKDSLSELGVNTFDIYSKRNRGRRSEGKAEKAQPPITLRQIERFIKEFDYNASVALETNVTSIAEVKYNSEKSNPNIRVKGVNHEFIALEGYDLEFGRNFSVLEVQNGNNVVILGSELKKTLFKNNEDPINKEVSFSGNKFRVIGVLEEKGGMGGSSIDLTTIIPYRMADRLAGGRTLQYSMTVGLTNVQDMDYAMGEATSLMRKIRKDRIGEDNSFELKKSESLAERMAEVTDMLRLIGFVIGFITLLGASIALMNIMMVTVTERTREVGIRKALGATPQRIRQQFIIEAIIVCLMGGFVGIIVGVLIGNLISLLMGIEGVVMPWLWMFNGVVICVAVGVFSGFYPAFKASKLDPIDSLRYE